MLDRKQLIIIDRLIQNPILTKDELTERYSLSDRQIDYSIDKLNQYLESNNKEKIDADGVYISVPSNTYEYLLKTRVSKNLTSLKSYVLSTKERQLFLILLLSTSNKYLSLIHLQELLQVSQSTASKDLKQLEYFLLSKKLRVSYDRKTGYRIVGREDAIRGCLIKSISDELIENKSELLNDFIDSNCKYGLKEVINLVTGLKEKFHIDFVENRLREFCYILTIVINRVSKRPNYVPTNVKKFSIKETNEYKFTEELLKDLGYTNSKTILYFSTVVLCLSIGDNKDLQVDDHIYKITEQLVNRFSIISGVNFSDNKKVISQIFTHFRSMYFRLQFKFPITNPLTKQVIKEYNAIFKLLSQTIDSFSKELGKVPDEEIAYLTIHLIGFIYEANQTKKNYLTAAIVCPNGIGSSALVYLQLTSIFPNIKFLMPFPYTDLNEHLDEIDMIFSTFYRSDLFTLNKPCFVINPVLSSEERYSIIQKVNSKFSANNFVSPTLDAVMKVVNNNVHNEITLKRIRKSLSEEVFQTHPVFDVKKLSLKDIIVPEFVQLNLNCNNYNEAINKSFQPFLNDKIISSKYLSAIIHEVEHGASFLIAPEISLPHANPKNGAKKIGIGITTLANPIKLMNQDEKVKYIFSLSAINSTDHLNALNDLMNFIYDAKFIKLLDDKSTEVEDVLKFIKQNSK